MAICVIDTSAVFVDLQGEAGSDKAREWLRDAAISTVNLQEIVAKAIQKGIPPDVVPDLLSRLRLDVHPHDEAQAMVAGRMRDATAGEGLSLGDRSCLALAAALNLPAVTADRAWAKVAEAVGVQVVLVR